MTNTEINSHIEIANTLTSRQCEVMANVEIEKELAGKVNAKTIRALEDIYWAVAAGKRAAALVGLST